MADKADFHDADATAPQEPSGSSAGRVFSWPGGSAGSDGARNLPTPGELWAGKYLVEAELSRSGQGIVFKAYSKVLDRHTALKVPLTQGKPKDEASWHEEARRLCDLAHPNIVRVLDAGSAEGTPYVATELIEGLPLSDYVQQKPPRTRQILHWMIQLVDALAAIHAKGITHRDLKPGNVIVRSDGRPVLIDFGISTRVTPYGPEPQAHLGWDGRLDGAGTGPRGHGRRSSSGHLRDGGHPEVPLERVVAVRAQGHARGVPSGGPDRSGRAGLRGSGGDRKLRPVASRIAESRKT